MWGTKQELFFQMFSHQNYSNYFNVPYLFGRTDEVNFTFLIPVLLSCFLVTERIRVLFAAKEDSLKV
jgi:hypothetical protein